MKDYIVESAIRDSKGLLQECPVCHADIQGLWQCEECHRTGLFAPPFLSPPAGNRAVVVARPVYKGTKQGTKGKVEVNDHPESYDLLKAATCCEVFRGFWLGGLWNQNVMSHTGDMNKERGFALEIGRFFKPPKRDDTEFKYDDPVVTLHGLHVSLRFCPNCGERVQLQLIGKRIEVTRIEKVESQTKYSEPDIVEG